MSYLYGYKFGTWIFFGIIPGKEHWLSDLMQV
jgi:hypothetical protein